MIEIFLALKKKPPVSCGSGGGVGDDRSSHRGMRMHVVVVMRLKKGRR